MNIRPSPISRPDAETTPAIRLVDVSKSYRLYDRPQDRLLDQLGLNRLMFWRARQPPHLFHALRGIDLTVAKGERVGIVGRNGAGKTTLLKLITQNFAPTSGAVEVDGTVQALMQLGIGFHMEFSGYENIKAALQYNGLTGAEFEAALKDVIEFVELGEFLHQPMKTYSLGMNARVQFATATAIRPDILIVDEVLGAGDGYFIAKSAHRMEQLTSSGCTLLLVSHSTAQVLQFCERCIFMHEGRIREDGKALDVVKHYEEFIAELTQREKWKKSQTQSPGPVPAASGYDYTTPDWQKEQLERLLVEPPVVRSGATKNRVSRWAAERGLKISRIEVRNENGKLTTSVRSGRPCSIEVEILAEDDGTYTARLSILVMTLTGIDVVRHLGDEFEVSLKAGQTHAIRLEYDTLGLARGAFVFSAALFKRYDPDDTSTAVRYDLLSRSFELNVVPIRSSDPALVNLPARWVHATPGERTSP